MNGNKSTEPLIPPFRFAIVEESLYRGSYPTDRNFRFLKRLKLKTIISLTPKPPTKSFYSFCERYGTNSKHFSVSKFKDDVTVSASQVVQLLEIMIDPNNLPLYVHCLDGANVTGSIFMCLRKLQNWNLSTIFSEFTRFTRGNNIASAEAEFVETFKAEIDVYPNIPNWLWQGIRMTKHPTLKLRLVNNNNSNGNDQNPLINSTFLFNPDSFQNGNSLNNSSQISKDTNINSSSFQPIPFNINNLSNLNTTTNTTSNITGSHSNLSSPITVSNSSLNNSTQIPQSIGSSTSSFNNLIDSTSQKLLSTVQSPRAISISANSQISSISTTTTTTTSSTSQKEKDIKKKKLIDDIKVQFDSGKFSIQNESKTLQALSLERSVFKSQNQQSQSNQPQTQQLQSQSQSQSPTSTPSELKNKSSLILSSSNLFK